MHKLSNNVLSHVRSFVCLLIVVSVCIHSANAQQAGIGQNRQAQGNAAGDQRPNAGSASGQISESQLSGLPLNGRSYSQLATLQSGVSDPSASSA